MTFIVFDHGLRTHTPWYDVFPPKSIEKSHPTARIKALQPDDENKESESPAHRRDSVTEAYRGLDDQQDKVPVLSAWQIMSSPVVPMLESLTLTEAHLLFDQHGFRHFPVINDKGQLVGIVSDRDILRADLQRQHRSGLNGLLSEIMQTRVLSAQPDTSIRHLAHAMYERHIGALPVVDDNNHLTGIVTRTDILGVILNEAPIEIWT